MKMVPHVDDIKGFTTGMIDGYLTLLWYTCAFVARDRRDRPGEGADSDHTTSLAQYDTQHDTESKDAWRFSFECAPPSVTILQCSQEVILRFKLSKNVLLRRDENSWSL